MKPREAAWQPVAANACTVCASAWHPMITITVTVTGCLFWQHILQEYEQPIPTLFHQCLCWVCAGILGERGLGLVDHVPLGCVAKINIP
jgi:hypothetical protein